MPRRREAEAIRAPLLSAGKRIGKSLPMSPVVGGSGRRPPLAGSSPGPRAVEGFLEPFPSPPRILSYRMRKALRKDDASGINATPPAAVIFPRNYRAGAPTKPPLAIRFGNKDGFFVGKRAYKRLDEARRKLHAENRMLRARWKRRFARRSKAERVALASLLLSAGVSASKFPYVLACVLMYEHGKVPTDLLFSTSSALRYVRISGAALRARIIPELSKARPVPFYVGFDTSGRGGHLGAVEVSFMKDKRPEHRFWGFNRPNGSTASDLKESLLDVISELRESGSLFGGFTTDAPNVMVGERGGLGALVAESFPSSRHDTCEHHASARLLAVLDSLWPPVMNVPSVSQFLYITWYILNNDWALHRARILKFLNLPGPSADVKAVLDRFSSKDEAIALVKKPEKPNKLRWGTLADVIEFVELFFEALRFSIEEERINAGANVPACSVASICVQWVKWSGSRRLRSLLSVANEFVEKIWKPANSLIDLRDTNYDLESCYKTFSRPQRTLQLVMAIESFQSNPCAFSSFRAVESAFPENMRGEVRPLFTRLFDLAHNSVLRNSGRYLSGIYLYSGFADPNFVKVVFEAFAWWKRKPNAPTERTVEGRCLEQFLNDSPADNSLDLLLDDSSWSRISALISARSRNKREFLNLILNAAEDDFALFQLKCWLPCLSHTGAVEKAFLDWDHQTQRGEGGTKARAAEASGKQVAPVTREAKVLVRNTVNKIQRRLMEKIKPEKKRPRIEGLADFSESVVLEFDALRFTADELQAAKVRSGDDHRYYATPVHGIPREIRMFCLLCPKGSTDGRKPSIVVLRC